MENKMLIAKIAEKTVEASVNSVSFYSMYQLKEPNTLNEKIGQQ